MAISVDPDETPRYEPSHMDLHHLHRYLFWSAGLKGKIKFTAPDKVLFFQPKSTDIFLFPHKSMLWVLFRHRPQRH